MISGITDSSLEIVLPALPYLAGFTLGDGFPLWALWVCFFLEVTAFGGVFFFFLFIFPWTNFIALSLLSGCLGRKMLYIKTVIILFYSSVESIFSSLQVRRPLWPSIFCRDGF